MRNALYSIWQSEGLNKMAVFPQSPRRQIPTQHGANALTASLVISQVVTVVNTEGLNLLPWKQTLKACSDRQVPETSNHRARRLDVFQTFERPAPNTLFAIPRLLLLSR